MIKLGSKVRDTISGFTGIATGRTEYMNGCVKILVTPQELDGKKMIGDIWIDDQQIEVIEEKEPEFSKDSVAKSGGPQSTPPKANMPKR